MQKPQVILQRLDVYKLVKRQSPVDDCCSDSDWSPKWDDNSNSSLSDEDERGSFTTPAKCETVDIKPEVDDDDEGVLESKKECPKCHQVFAHLSKLKRHHDAVHLRLKPFKCTTCPKSFSRQYFLKCHIDAVHLGLKPYRCDLCGKSFGCNIYLQKHKRAVHLGQFGPPVAPKEQEPRNPEPKMFPCAKCEKSFDHAERLRRHMRHHAPARLPCDLCKKLFRYFGELNKHVLSVHVKRRLSCQVEGCKATYAYPSALSLHCRMKHSQIKRSTTNAQPSRKYSEKYEHGQLVFECQLCSKTLKTKVGVMEHLTKVHGPKQFMCESCGYKTGHKPHLQKHIERHHKTDDPVSCRFCKKQFNSIRLVKIHVRNVHAEKKWQCQYCGYATPLSCHLKTHLKNVHKMPDAHEY